MDELKFIWDENKALKNQKKHNVSFEEAKTVFLDDFGRLIPDPDHSEGEARFILLGQSTQFKLLTVCHCYRENGEQIRIISARKANKFEQKQYRGFHNER
ncbi:MAG: BrnT family toxin [Candidatus Thiodiazotropha sp. (ex Lucinoma kastoroae)]|nr:BrnT family toxin [Candidatus Thiodiazotropha sp. (ex Lucinoma kastoroae)]